jgi:hypothetical protein
MAAEDRDPALRSDLQELLSRVGTEAADVNYSVVQSGEQLERLARDILGERARAIVGVTHRLSVCEPVLRCSDIRTVVGPRVRIYLLADEHLLLGLRELVGPRLRLDAGSLRIWWPGASPRCDPAAHPQIVGLQDEDYLDTLQQLAHEYHLSRPLVRAHLELIEDARALVEHEMVRLQEYNGRIHERLRDAHIECHVQRSRAEAAEARLAQAVEASFAQAAEPPPVHATRPAGERRWPQPE